MRAYLRARDTRHQNAEIGAPLGIPLRHRRLGVGRAAELLVLRRLLADHDPFAHLVSFTMTIAYACGIFGRNFANARFVIVQIVCTWAADDRGAAALRRPGSLDFCRASGSDLSRHQADRRKTAPHAARRRGHLARHVAACQAVRHRAQQHAARPVHVRRQAPHRGLQSEAQRAVGTAGRSRTEGHERARTGRERGEGGTAFRARRAQPDRPPGRAAFRQRRLRRSPSTCSTAGRSNSPCSRWKTAAWSRWFEDITERKIAEAKINHLARFDR